VANGPNIFQMLLVLLSVTVLQVQFNNVEFEMMHRPRCCFVGVYVNKRECDLFYE